MIFGVLLLAATIHRTFTDLFDSVYGKTDLVVSGSGRRTRCRPRRSTQGASARPGVDEPRRAASSSVFTLRRRGRPRPPTDAAEQLNVAGAGPGRRRDLTDSETVDGREPERGREIALQESWAEANEIDGRRPDARSRPRTASGGFDVVGLFQFSSGLDFGGEGFAAMPLGPRARGDGQAARGYDEVERGRRRRRGRRSTRSSGGLRRRARQGRRGRRRRRRRATRSSRSSRRSTRSSTSSPRWPSSSAAS